MIRATSGLSRVVAGKQTYNMKYEESSNMKFNG